MWPSITSRQTSVLLRLLGVSLSMAPLTVHGSGLKSCLYTHSSNSKRVSKGEGVNWIWQWRQGSRRRCQCRKQQRAEGSSHGGLWLMGPDPHEIFFTCAPYSDGVCWFTLYPGLYVNVLIVRHLSDSSFLSQSALGNIREILRIPFGASALGFMYILSEFPPKSMVALFRRPCKGLVFSLCLPWWSRGT